ncbi:MAG: hypothetical protein LAP39_10135 [Acidobacteriia bacterium]|nr:hypothetical protein [Terriglobia bacterium]
MLNIARDMLALSYFEKKLGELREDYILAAKKGVLPEPDFLESRERSIFRETQDKFYNREARSVCNPNQADEVTDEQDFASRTQQIAERALFITHRKLAGIPFFGHPEYAE